MRLFKFLLLLILPLLIPLLILVAVNYRTPIVTDADYNLHKCSMACYYNTTYCKAHHVVYLKHYLPITDKAYFGVIKFLQSKANYERANILYLVIGWPFIMYMLLEYSITLQMFIINKKKQYA